ncbi:anti-sigma factor [Fontimonas sp. SYSU GA230001]|uniref:anti-sigma factor n=1 Tax=Fontimonas sp. SYSU GA230001 TaxID=3142450 RepID=UPI0032B390F9
MKYVNARLGQMLAAEYVLGTLTGRARRRFVRLLQSRADLRAEVSDWERRLAALHAGFKPVAPREIVWAAIQREIESGARVVPLRPTGGAPDGRLRFWQAWSALATAASVVLAFGLYREVHAPAPPVQIVRVEVPVPQPMPYVALLQPGGSKAQWLVTLSPERRRIRVSGMGDYPMDAARESLELWVIGADGKPVSLGLLPAKGEADMPMPRGMSMPAQPALAVSREPPGGSPTGQPTGPVIVVGPAQRAS